MLLAQPESLRNLQNLRKKRILLFSWIHVSTFSLYVHFFWEERMEMEKEPFQIQIGKNNEFDLEPYDSILRPLLDPEESSL